MPAGIIIRDADNNVIMDTTARVTRVLGNIDISATTTVTHAGFADGEPFCIFTFQGAASGRDQTQYGPAPIWCPEFSMSGNKMTMTVPVAGFQVFKAIYGIY